MIYGFDAETKPLTEYEAGVLLPLLIAGLSLRVGKASSVTNSYIVKTLRNKGYELSEVRVRKLINHIRTHGLINGLIATNGGYYIAESRQELIDYIDSLKGRESAISQVRKSMEVQLRNF